MSKEEDVFVGKIQEVAKKFGELVSSLDRERYSAEIVNFALLQYAAEMVVIDSHEGKSLGEKVENELEVYRRCLLWNLSKAGRIKVYEMNGKTIVTEDT